MSFELFGFAGAAIVFGMNFGMLIESRNGFALCGMIASGSAMMIFGVQL